MSIECCPCTDIAVDTGYISKYEIDVAPDTVEVAAHGGHQPATKLEVTELNAVKEQNRTCC